MNLNTDFLPEPFKENIVKQYPNECDMIYNGCCKKISSLRINRLKTNADKCLKSFAEKDIMLSKASFCDDVFYSNCDVNQIKDTDEFKNGEIYLQSLSSCLPVILLNPQPSEDILDMAAAPGGKTTQIASLTNGKANITACERNPMRVEKLKYNLDKQGVKNVNVINKDARQLEDWFKFDKILLDAPCSGSGTLISENNNSYFTQKLINNTTKTQKALFEKAVKLLKKDGILVYSTCSILKEENENIIKSFIDKGILEIIEIDLSKFNDVPLLPSSLKGVITVCPTNLYEGFFVSVLRKK